MPNRNGFTPSKFRPASPPVATPSNWGSELREIRSSLAKMRGQVAAEMSLGEVRFYYAQLRRRVELAVGATRIDRKKVIESLNAHEAALMQQRRDAHAGTHRMPALSTAAA